MGSHPQMKYLSKEEMEKLTTRRLLAYRNRLLKCRETYSEDNDLNKSETVKESSEWQENYKLTKTVLACREHVER